MSAADVPVPPTEVTRLRLITLGNSNVGKTSLLLRYCNNVFAHVDVTPGIEFKVKTLVIDGRPVRCEVWDTAGQERFRSLAPGYLRNVVGAAVVYDITDMSTFKGVQHWLRELRANYPAAPGSHDWTGVPMVLIGNKLDVVEHDEGGAGPRHSSRAVPKEQGEALAAQLGIPFFEASAKTGFMVQRAFDKLAHDSYRRLMAQPAHLRPSHAVHKILRSPDAMQLEDAEGESTAWPRESCC